MKRFQKWSPICLALVVGLVAGWMVVQQVSVTPSEAQRAPEKPVFRKIPASPEPPPEVQQQEQEQQQLPPPSQRRSTVQELEQQLLNLPGGREAVERARANRRDRVIAASPEPPPDVQQLEEEQKQVPQPSSQRSTVQELEEKLRNLPGGRETLEKARRGEKPTGMQWDGVGDFLSWLNPFQVPEAEAGATFTLTLSHTLKSGTSVYNLYSSSPYGYAAFYGAYDYCYTPIASNPQILYSTKNWGDGTSNTLQGYMFTAVTLPADGYYIVNINAYTSGSVSLRHYEGGAYPVLQTQTLGSGYKDYPYMAYFAAGTHHFYWTFSATAYVTRVTVDSYP